MKQQSFLALRPERRTILVTHGTGELGSAVCKKLADLGHFVAATYDDENQAFAWQIKMEKEGYYSYIYEYKAADFCESLNLVRRIAQDLGPVQGLINVTGMAHGFETQKMAPRQWQNVIGHDLESTFNLTHAVIDGMVATGFGRIVNISPFNLSRNQLRRDSYPAAWQDVYTGIRMLERAVVTKGITINTVSPGFALTVSEECDNGLSLQASGGSLSRPEDVARLVSFLVSEDAPS